MYMYVCMCVCVYIYIYWSNVDVSIFYEFSYKIYYRHLKYIYESKVYYSLGV